MHYLWRLIRKQYAEAHFQNCVPSFWGTLSHHCSSFTSSVNCKETEMSFDSSRSGTNSAQPSKRSMSDSHSSKSGSGSNSKRSKTSSKQKTLGMAWGSNSLSSSRSSFRNSPFSDFGSYMSEKTRKLRQQFDDEASNSSDTSSKQLIFQGVSIFIDGFTIPSNQELRSYMLGFGGRFENYFSRHRVTHIICSNLPDSKRKNLRSFSGGLPVVKPAWIVDSVFANRLLNWVPYQLDQLGDNQPRLSAFFTPKSSSLDQDASGVAGQVIVDPCLEGGRSNDADLAEVHELLNVPQQDTLVVRDCQTNLDSSMIAGTTMNDDFSEVHESISVTTDENPQLDSQKYNTEVPSSSKCSDVRMGVHDNSDTESEINVGNRFHLSSDNLSGSVGMQGMHNQNTVGTKEGAVVLSNQRHSTLGDPNFVENYFKSSRLHFIGTWRNRYRKRYGNNPSYLKNQNAKYGVSDASHRPAIIHIDMDCFFVSVVIRNRADLQDKPVAICHSDNPKGTAEISSANYPARNFGIKAGMFVREAKTRCPDLIIFPYNFQAYEEVADKFYDILHKHCTKVQAVSCDEAFLEATHSAGLDPELLASEIRKEIFVTTGCSASAGIAGNMLMARVATRAAKPNGQCYIPQEKVEEHLELLPIKTLPGIGHVLAEKLKNRNIQTCGQLRLISKGSLQSDFGAKTGEMLWNYSRGVDNRSVGVTQESKSIGAEVNWGVRFKALEDSYRFLADLCKEVSLRLQGCGARGRTFTLKIKKRRKDAGEPVKYMGHGDCENLSHSMTIPIATDEIDVLERITKQLFGGFHVDIRDIRGVGLQVSKLENADASNEGLERSSLRSWLSSASATKAKQRSTRDADKESSVRDSDIKSNGGTSRQLFPDQMGSVQMDDNLQNDEPCLSDVSAPPPLCHLDIGVLENLPSELFSELNNIYGGKLVALIDKSKEEKQISSNPSRTRAPDNVAGAEVSDMVPLNHSVVEEEVKQQSDEDTCPHLVSGAGYDSQAIHQGFAGDVDFLPSSLSQVDTSVFHELPEELRDGIVGLLPAHRKQGSPSTATVDAHADNAEEFTVMKTTDNQSKAPENDNDNDPLTGDRDPPRWVDKFRVSKCMILNALAEMYEKWGPTVNLSTLLQHLISEYLHLPDQSFDVWDDESTCDFCNLLKQYIEINLQSDIEEIYLCFRLLRRLAEKSKPILQVYNTVLPCLQASFGEIYGGSLNI
ncbi:DNA repair protein REV1 [Linum perenne]